MEYAVAIQAQPCWWKLGADDASQTDSSLEFWIKLVLIWLGLGVVGWSIGLGTSSQGQTVIDSPKLFRITLCRSFPEHIDALGE